MILAALGRSSPGACTRRAGRWRPPVAPGGVNLVVYTDSLEASDRLDVHDPGGLLPKNQDSWR